MDSPIGAQFGSMVQSAHFLRGVVGELHDAELLAVGIEFVDECEAISTWPPSK